MNISKLSREVAWSDYDYLRSMKPDDESFWFYAKHKHLYNQIEFIDCFKDFGTKFWYNVVFESTISMDVLFSEFEKYLMDEKLRSLISSKFSKNVCTDYTTYVRLCNFYDEIEKKRFIQVEVLVE